MSALSIIRARGQQASIKAAVMLAFIGSELLISAVTLIRGYESASPLIKTDISDLVKQCSFTDENFEYRDLALHTFIVVNRK